MRSNVHAVNTKWGGPLSIKCDNDGLDGAPSAGTMVQLLSAVEAGTSSQRGVASELGVALGLANAMIKRCVRKGLIKIVAAPARRYAYYLTPQGLAEKSRLVSEYVSESLRFFGVARAQYVDIWRACAVSGNRRVLLWGRGEVAEIALLSADGEDVEIVGVVDAAANVQRFHSLPVFARPGDCRSFDVVVLTDPANSQAAYEEMVAAIGPQKSFAPAFLHVVKPTASPCFTEITDASS